MGSVMNPREFRELATILAAKEDSTSAELRTAVSRAYYAVYNVAVDFLQKIGVKHAGGWEAHRMIPEALRYGSDEELSGAALELVDLRRMRWAADYDMQDREVEDQRTVQKLAARAKQAIKKMDGCQDDPARATLARGKIRGWAGSAEGARKGFTVL